MLAEWRGGGIDLGLDGKPPLDIAVNGFLVVEPVQPARGRNVYLLFAEEDPGHSTQLAVIAGLARSPDVFGYETRHLEHPSSDDRNDVLHLFREKLARDPALFLDRDFRLFLFRDCSLAFGYCCR